MYEQQLFYNCYSLTFLSVFILILYGLDTYFDTVQYFKINIAVKSGETLQNKDNRILQSLYHSYSALKL